MRREEPEWVEELRQSLASVLERYTRDRYARTLETQRGYEQAIDGLEDTYRDRLRTESKAEQRLLSEHFQQDATFAERLQQLERRQAELRETLDRAIQTSLDRLNERFTFSREDGRGR